MEKIGLKLQEKRKELKLTYKDISDLTKLPITTIKAIEEGNLDYFKDDLTYVRFYVRSYCKAVNIPYEKFKANISDAVLEYSQTISMKIIKEHEKIESNISGKNIELPEKKQPRLAKRDRSSIMQNAQQSSRFRKAKRLDFAFLSLIVVIIIIVMLLIYVGFTSFVNAPKSDKEVNTKDKVVNNQATPKPEEEKPKKEEEKETPVKSNVVFTQDSVSSFFVSGIKVNEPIKLEVTFKNAGSFNLWKGKTSAEGAYNVYEAGATYTYQGVVSSNELLTLNFWNFGGATIKINDTELKYDAAAIVPKDGVTFITLTTKGE